MAIVVDLRPPRNCSVLVAVTIIYLSKTSASVGDTSHLGCEMSKVQKDMLHVISSLMMRKLYKTFLHTWS